MRHGNNNKTLGRTKNQRTALFRSLAGSLILNGKIKTTEAKAKELQPFIEKIITKGKENTLAARRIIASRLGEPTAQTTKKVFDLIAPKFKTRAGGYTRVIKLGRTKAGRDEAIIEFVE